MITPIHFFDTTYKNWKAPFSSLQEIHQAIEKIAQISNKTHALKNMENGKIKENHKNSVTRAITAEFFFYLEHKPLSISEFHSVIEKVYKISEKAYPNVVFVLSSFAVSDGEKVYNTAIVAQSGICPFVQYSVKNFASDVDPSYESLSKYEKKADMLNPQLKLSNHRPIHESMIVSPLFEMETEGGVKWHLILEICLDHLHLVGKTFLAEMKRNKEKGPLLVSHVVSSSSVDVNPNHIIGKEITHVTQSELLKSPQKISEKKIRRHFPYLIKDMLHDVGLSQQPPFAVQWAPPKKLDPEITDLFSPSECKERRNAIQLLILLEKCCIYDCSELLSLYTTCYDYIYKNESLDTLKEHLKELLDISLEDAYLAEHKIKDLIEKSEDLSGWESTSSL